MKESPNLKQFVKENASVMFGLDKRIFTTLKHLLFHPGTLTRAFAKGDVRSFTPPTTLYFTINLLFFLLLPLVNSGGIKLLSFSYNGFTKVDGAIKELILKDLEQSGLSEAVYRAQFDSFITYNQPALIFVLIPFLVLILRILNLNNRTALLSHTVYAFHFMSFFLLTFLLLGTTVNMITSLFHYLRNETIIPYLFGTPLIVYAIWMFFYLFKSLKVVYENPFWVSLLKSLALCLSFIGLMFVYTSFLMALCVLSVN